MYEILKKRCEQKRISESQLTVYFKRGVITEEEYNELVRILNPNK